MRKGLNRGLRTYSKIHVGQEGIQRRDLVICRSCLVWVGIARRMARGLYLDRKLAMDLGVSPRRDRQVKGIMIYAVQCHYEYLVACVARARRSEGRPVGGIFEKASSQRRCGK